MNSLEVKFAQYLGQVRCDLAQLYWYQPQLHGDADKLRAALRQYGVPALELNGAPEVISQVWIETAKNLSTEFLVPIVIFWGGLPINVGCPSNVQEIVTDETWLAARQVALTEAVETCLLNQEYRRDRDKSGKLCIGWHDEAALNQGNRMLLAWSSPLPLRSIRNFSARCPNLELSGSGSEILMKDVAAQGISVAQWRFAVK